MPLQVPIILALLLQLLPFAALRPGCDMPASAACAAVVEVVGVADSCCVQACARSVRTSCAECVTCVPVHRVPARPIDNPTPPVRILLGLPTDGPSYPLVREASRPLDDAPPQIVPPPTNASRRALLCSWTT